MTDAAYDHCAAIVRAGDPDRYISDLFAAEVARRHLFALHAFAGEVSSIRGKVSEPKLGEIRLKWWEGALRGDHGGSPIASALALTIADFALPIEAFDRFLEAHVFDLYDDQMLGLTDLEGYVGETESALMQLGAIILAGGHDPATAELAGYAGVAYGLARLTARLAPNAAAGQSYLPADLLLRHGVPLQELAAGQTTPELRSALAELRAVIRRRLAEARTLVPALEPGLLPAFLPVALIDSYLLQMERTGFDPLHATAEITPLRRQWRLWRAARRGRI